MHTVYQSISFCGFGRKKGSFAGYKIFGKCASTGDYDDIGGLLFEKRKLFVRKQRDSGNPGYVCGGAAAFVETQYIAQHRRGNDVVYDFATAYVLTNCKVIKELDIEEK